MTRAEQLRRTLKRFASEVGPIPTVLAQVTSVDPAERTCVLDDGDIEYIDVRLRPVVDATKSITLIPKVGTWALAVRIEESDDWMVLAVGEADEILINSPAIVFNDGTKGGLPNWPEVVAELNKTKDLVNTIKSVLTGWTVVAGDGGAALKAFAATQLAAKVAGVYENKEDLTVKH